MSSVADLSEADLQSHVIDLARMLGYRVAHFRPALTKHGWRTPVAADGKGFPDLVLLRPGRIIFAELKSTTGRVDEDQAAWLDAAAAAGAETYVWRPADLQAIAEVLRGPDPRRSGRYLLICDDGYAATFDTRGEAALAWAEGGWPAAKIIPLAQVRHRMAA